MHRKIVAKLVISVAFVKEVRSRGGGGRVGVNDDIAWVFRCTAGSTTSCRGGVGGAQSGFGQGACCVPPADYADALSASPRFGGKK